MAILIEKSVQISSRKINPVGNNIASLHNSAILIWDFNPIFYFFIPFWKIFYAKPF